MSDRIIWGIRRWRAGALSGRTPEACQSVRLTACRTWPTGPRAPDAPHEHISPGIPPPGGFRSQARSADHRTSPRAATRESHIACLHASNFAQSPNPHVYSHCLSIYRMLELCKFLNAPIAKSGEILSQLTLGIGFRIFPGNSKYSAAPRIEGPSSGVGGDWFGFGDWVECSDQGDCASVAPSCGMASGDFERRRRHRPSSPDRDCVRPARPISGPHWGGRGGRRGGWSGRGWRRRRA